MSQKDKDILDWEELSQSDQLRAEELLNELNNIFNKYRPKENEACEDSISEE
jgi:hypothetical protein